MLAVWLDATPGVAQDLVFNVPYVCRNGLALTVLRCERSNGADVCTYERRMNGQLLNTPIVRRTTMVNLVARCERQSGKTAPQIPNPSAASTAQTPTSASPQHRPPASLGQPPTGATGPQSTNPPYLAQFPSVDRLKAEVTGANAMDTSARQMGAFWQFQEIIKEMSGVRWATNALTADEKRVLAQYAAAYQEAARPYASSPDRAKWYQIHALYETNEQFREHLFSAWLSPAIRDQWAQVRGDTRARVDSSKQAQEEAFQRARAGTARDAPWSQREWARCLAIGNTENVCVKRLRDRTLLTDSGRPVLDSIQGMFGLSEDSSEEVTPGLAPAGVYSGTGGFRMGFGAAGVASVKCGDIITPANYLVEWTGNTLEVRLIAVRATGIRDDRVLASGHNASIATSADPEKWQDQRIVLSIRADGKLSGSGPIKVTGPVRVGTKHGTKTVTTYTATGKATREEPIVVAVYENRTVTCALGLLTPTGKVSAVETGTAPNEILGGVHGVGQVGEALHSAFTATSVDDLKNLSKTMAERDPDPGLRMQGRYTGAGGLDIEFLQKQAVVGCGRAAFPRAYSVAASGSRVVVTIQNNGMPMTFELKPDGTLVGSSAATFEGRALVSLDVNTRPVFQAVSDACSAGVLEPSRLAQ